MPRAPNTGRATHGALPSRRCRRVRAFLKPLLLLVSLALLSPVSASAQRERVRWLAAPRKTVIKADVNTVAHVYWNGTALVDAKGNAWTQVGTVPMVAAAPPLPAGSGPYASGKSYTLGSGADVLDFTDGFTCTAIVAPGATGTVQYILVDGSSSAGWDGAIAANGLAQVVSRASPAVALYSVTAVPVGVSVFSWGKSGSTLYLKLNADATRSAAITTWTPLTSSFAARLGVWPDGSTGPFRGTIYEIACSSTPFDDGVVTSRHERARARLGLSW